MDDKVHSLVEICCKLLALVALAACAAMAGTTSPATPPPTVAFCDLASNPQAFDGQWVQVRGHVSLGFEDFTLYEPGCDKPLTRRVWLMYGGEEETSKDIRVRRQPVSLIRDSAMESFTAKVPAHRKRQVNGEPCVASNCNFYSVAANITGLFLAAPNNPQNPASGFGHFGCCHLLVIHRVSSVVAERTAVPDDEGVFTCSKQSWRTEFPQPEHEMLDRQAVNKKFLAQQMRQHGDAELVEVMRNTLSRELDGRLTWMSSDLLTTYSVPLTQGQSEKKRSQRIVTVTRERCVPAPDKP